MSHVCICVLAYAGCTRARTHTHTHTHTLSPFPSLPDLPMVWRVRFSSGYGIKPNLTSHVKYLF